VLGLYFMARRGRDLVAQMTTFIVAHGLALALTLGGIVSEAEAGAPWVAMGVALSIVGVALVNFFSRETPGRGWLIFVAGAGLLHGFALAPAFSLLAPSQQQGLAIAGIALGVATRTLVIIGAAAVLTGAWRQRLWYCDRPGITIPASMMIALGGLVLAVVRVQGALAPGP
jgi:hypothetical protein